MSGSFRKICEPPVMEGIEVSALDIRSRRQFRTTGSDVMEKYISSSFLPILREIIPHSDNPPGFGGCWFWGCYFHGLYGEDMLVDLNGTGVSLSEDPLDTQVALRKKSFSLAGDESNKVILEHCCSKLEALCGLCLSVVLHVARQPMLEDGEGPQALVLCATKDQCDEVHELIDRFGSGLHLVTHNLFGAYPPMPAERRADIVVGTLPLWESVVHLAPRSSQDELEEILYHLPYDTNRAASTTRWRPYSLAFVTQLLLIDLDLQHSLGYWPLLLHLFAKQGQLTPSIPRRPNGSEGLKGSQCSYVHGAVLPKECQVYCLVDGCGEGRKLFGTLLDSRKRDYALESIELACISLRAQSLNMNARAMDSANLYAQGRTRQDSNDESSDAKRVEKYIPRLEVYNALSHSRLLVDASALAEFAAEAVRCALSFWSRFEGTPHTEDVENASSVVDVSLAYTCINSGRYSGEGESAWFVTKMMAVITPTEHTAMHPSRTTLLIKHLADEFSGQIFDGGVLQCFCRCQAIEPVDPLDVVLGPMFSATAKSLSGEPLFFPACGTEVVDGDMSVVARHRAELHKAVMKASSTTNVSTLFPLYKFLSTVPRLPWNTVLVFRRIDSSSSLFCGIQGEHKPTALLYLEECCQYGKVISFFVYQRLDVEDGAEGSVDFFVEFQTCEGAIEAVKQFSIRLATQNQRGEGTAQVRFFPNDLYYEGVSAELRKLGGGNTRCDEESEAMDSDEDFFGISLLAER
ncbi:uncharacterized protein TEOVI_000261300 [Trypanosoma equiperdum]|uniref:Uncharacterized protein n=2 Tax=Trypanozoon TaxID=39700 RepID=Q57ZJ0_TRYB2|nr:hypothetical protein, conserved [Trypanosoma brucei brucei TREU927]AAX79491.1 hypothetical protein, conserved [Trypanosoma brucei]AAZ12563.1 hypothetical protein, conserved [Trypanosoma brucei brucei TREU927]SCU71033.1 hypothetical protein, conserved [Trypanosoma equiperdum]